MICTGEFVRSLGGLVDPIVNHPGGETATVEIISLAGNACTPHLQLDSEVCSPAEVAACSVQLVILKWTVLTVTHRSAKANVSSLAVLFVIADRQGFQTRSLTTIFVELATFAWASMAAQSASRTVNQTPSVKQA